MVLAPNELIISGVLQQELIDPGCDLLDLRILLWYSVGPIVVCFRRFLVHVVVIKRFWPILFQTLEQLLHLLLFDVFRLPDLVELVEELGDFVELSLIRDYQMLFLALLLFARNFIRDKNRVDKTWNLFMSQFSL